MLALGAVALPFCGGLCTQSEANTAPRMEEHGGAPTAALLEGYARSGGCRSRAVQPHVKSSGHAALEPHCKARATTAPPVRWTSQRIPKSQHCTPHDARAVATAANGSKSICLGVLVNEGPRTLVATLASWRAKGLLDAVAERYMSIDTYYTF